MKTKCSAKRRGGAAIRSLFAAGMWMSAFGPILIASDTAAQALDPSHSQTGEKFRFDVASVRQNKSGPPPNGDKPSSNVPLGPGNVYSPTGGLVSIKNYTLLSYITFAYKMTDGQLEAFRGMAPDWVINDRFNIQARTEKSDVTKDQLRVMMRSLIAERFNLSVHYETRQISVYGLQMVRSGTMGPKLQSHPADSLCPTTLPAKATASIPAPAETIAGGFPTTCGGIVLLPASDPHRYNIGGRSISMSHLATDGVLSAVRSSTRRDSKGPMISHLSSHRSHPLDRLRLRSPRLILMALLSRKR